MKILTVEDIEKDLKVSKETVYRFIKQGDLPAFKVGGKWRVLQEDYEKFIVRTFRPTRAHKLQETVQRAVQRAVDVVATKRTAKLVVIVLGLGVLLSLPIMALAFEGPTHFWSWAFLILFSYFVYVFITKRKDILR